MKLQIIARSNDGGAVISEGQRDTILDCAGSDQGGEVMNFLADLVNEATRLRADAAKALAAHQARERIKS